MDDKNLIHKIQKDIFKSNAKIISNHDNESTIKRKLNSKYTEDISDSDNEHNKNDDDEELISYKNRNSDIISQIKKNKLSTGKNTKLKVKNNLNSNPNSNPEANPEANPDENPDENPSDYKYEFTEDFTNKVKQYVVNDNRIKELQTELKTLTNAKRVAEVEILKHLERMGETTINITGGKLRVNQYESKEGLKEEIIKEVLVEKIQDPKIIEAIFEKINEKREAGGKIQRSLKRTSERAKNNDKK